MSEARIDSLSNESNTGGPTLSGITTFSGTNYFVPPVGNTEQRPENPQKGALRFNTDTKHLEYFRGNTIGWVDIEASHGQLGGGTGSNAGAGARGLWSGGDTPTIVTLIEYITISTLGNSATFGDLVDKKTNHFEGSSRTTVLWAGGYNGPSRTNSIQTQTFSSLGTSVDAANLQSTTSTMAANLSNGIRAVFAGGTDGSVRNVIDYVSIASVGDAKDFGDSTAVHYTGSGCSSTTRGVYNLGVTSAPARINTMDYINIASTGNAKDFGDLTTNRNGTGALSNSIRGIWGGGETPSQTDIMDFVTIATIGNAIDFGDMLSNRWNASGDGASSSTRGVWGGGSDGSRINTIQYIQIATQGDAVNFGDLQFASSNLAACSNGHGGLG